MDVLKKLGELRQDFELCGAEIGKRNEVIEQANREISQLVDKQKQLQGAFLMAVEMGVDLGVCDQQGNPIQTVEAKPESNEVAPTEEAN
jgi:predicted peroxiredoxin